MAGARYRLSVNASLDALAYIMAGACHQFSADIFIPWMFCELEMLMADEWYSAGAFEPVSLLQRNGVVDKESI